MVDNIARKGNTSMAMAALMIAGNVYCNIELLKLKRTIHKFDLVTMSVTIR